MPAKLPTVASLWVSYRVGVLPIEASEIQVSECRRAFYAGAHALLVDVLLGPHVDGMRSEAVHKYFDECEEELKRFARDVVEGRS